jgi:hypothetical protein
MIKVEESFKSIKGSAYNSSSSKYWLINDAMSRLLDWLSQGATFQSISESNITTMSQVADDVIQLRTFTGRVEDMRMFFLFGVYYTIVTGGNDDAIDIPTTFTVPEKILALKGRPQHWETAKSVLCVMLDAPDEERFVRPDILLKMYPFKG